VAAALLRDQLGVFEGFSDDDDFHWSQISSIRPQERPQSPGCSSPEHDRPMPQTDGAGDDSASADSASRPDLPEMDEEDASEADSKVRSQQQTGRAEASRQRVKSAGSQQTQSSSQRFGGLSLQKASPSSKSAPAPYVASESTASAQGGEYHPALNGCNLLASCTVYRCRCNGLAVSISSSYRHGKTLQAIRGADSICAAEQGYMMLDAAPAWLAWRQLGAESRHALSDLSSWTYHPTLMAAGNRNIPLCVGEQETA